MIARSLYSSFLKCACLRKYGAYERADVITIVRSYRALGWGNLKDVVTIELPPVLLRKLMNSRKVVQNQSMFIGAVQWVDSRSAVLTIDGFSPQARFCRAHKRLWGGWAVERPGIIE